MDMNNNKRLIASQVIAELYQAGQRKQLELLAMQVEASLRELNKKPGGQS